MYHLIVFVAFLMIIGATSDVQLQCSDITEYCLSEPVEYQCTVTGSNILRWRIRDETMTSLDTVSYTDGDDIDPGSETDVPQFSTDLSSTAPSIISNISFTVQSSINGYTILCEDGEGDTPNPNCTIIIADPPASPSNVTVTSFSSSSVDVTWFESPSSGSMCFNGYQYNVSSPTETRIFESFNTNAVVGNLVPSDDQYCVTVSAIDTANRTSSGNEQRCFIFNVPLMVADLYVMNDTETNITVEVFVEWAGVDFNVSKDVFTPPLIGYRVMITNSTDLSDYSNSSAILSPQTTEYTFTGVPTGREYNVTVLAINGVGISEPAFFMFDAPGPFVDIRTPTSTTTQSSTTRTTSALGNMSVMSSPGLSTTATGTTRSTTSTSTTSPTRPVPTSAGSSSEVPVGAIVGGILAAVVLLVLLIVVILLLYICFIKKRSKVDKSVPVVSLTLQSKSPDVGDPLYNSVDENKVVTAPAGDSKAPPPSIEPTQTTEINTYQDPSTIKREPATTGDLYALPEKKITTSEAKLGGEYAELDLPSKSSEPPSEQTTVVMPTSQQPVVYADVRGQ